MEDPKEPEVKDGVKEAVKEVREEALEERKEDDRPEENWKAELARKNVEIDRLRSQMESARQSDAQRRDPADIRTWTDHELKMLKNSNDPSVSGYKDQADEILLERKVHAIRSRERNEERRIAADLELRSSYPEALDPSSEFSSRLEKTLYDYDLVKTPAGRLVAAKIVAAEMGKDSSKSEAKGRKNEADRVSRVKNQMVDGDRPKPADGNEGKMSPDKRKQLEERTIKGDDLAVAELLKEKGLTRDSLFGKR